MENKILDAQTGELFVEILSLGCLPSGYCKGIGAVYHPQKEEVWVYPKEGWTAIKAREEFTKMDDLEKIWQENYAYNQELYVNKNLRRDRRRTVTYLVGGELMSKSQWVGSLVYDIKVSENGKFVTFKKVGLFFDSSYRWSIEYGAMD